MSSEQHAGRDLVTAHTALPDGIVNDYSERTSLLWLNKAGGWMVLVNTSIENMPLRME